MKTLLRPVAVTLTGLAAGAALAMSAPAASATTADPEPNYGCHDGMCPVTDHQGVDWRQADPGPIKHDGCHDGICDVTSEIPDWEHYRRGHVAP
ncbi:hypothetical protein GCM10009678_64920 [Actinomadura kijaniata]|uniref:Secreted protein n=1 Tax=Actinomadura namibiensis TaxID=182080 RepID=A0A7W3QR90_ACTNM|nr:hypothetical protein [Actinomadura namibiensis]MBA8956426.1 hypothetical protein [Actinomadura namibiensis]